MTNEFLKILYSNDVDEQALENYFTTEKDNALFGDSFAEYAAFIIDLVCRCKESHISRRKADKLISNYRYPYEYAQQLSKEIAALI